MPNPNNPDEFECRRCNDTGCVVGTTDTLCRCVSGNPADRDHPFTAMLAVIDGGESRVCGIKVDGVICMKRKEEHYA